MSKLYLHTLIKKIKAVLFHSMKLTAVLVCLLLCSSNAITKVIPLDNNVNFNLSTSISKKTDCATCISPNTNAETFNNKSSIRFNKRFQSKCCILHTSHFFELIKSEKKFAELNFSIIKCFTIPPFSTLCLRGPPVL